MKGLSLFSGAGGDTCGMHNAGIDVVAFSENDPHAILSHKENYPDCVLLEHNGKSDITKIPDSVFEKYIGQVDIIFAGFPCQAFSHGGKKNSTDDPRGTLFLEFARATKIIKPKFIIGENVPGLLQRKSKDGEAIFPKIIETFEDLGYKMYWKVMDSSDFNTPQKRKRLFMVGVLNNQVAFEFPSSVNKRYLSSILTNSLENAFEIDKLPNNTIVAFDTQDDIEITGEAHPFLKLNAERETISFGKRESPNHAEIINPNGFSKTIICAYQFQPRLYVAIRNKGKNYLRTFDITELAQIQGFPKDYIFKGSYNQKIKQIGNAVPPNIVTAICQILKKNS